MSLLKRLMPTKSDAVLNTRNHAADAELVADFIDREGPAIHPGFAASSHFDKQRAIYTPRARHHDLEAALDGYVPGQTNGVNLDFDPKTCTWVDVLDEADKAEKVYLDGGKGPKNVVRKTFRKAGDYADAISPWFDLIPDEYGLSVLNGGLKLIFRAIAEQANVRTKIMSTFREIPDIIRTSEAKRRVFKSDRKLQGCCIELYNTLLDAVRDLILLLLVDNGLCRNLRALFKGSVSGNNVDEVLERINGSFSVLQKCVDDIRDEKASGTHSTAQRIEREAKAIRLNTKNTEVEVKSFATKISNIEGNLGSLAKDIRENRQRISDENSRTNAYGIEAQNGFFDFLQGVLKNMVAHGVFPSHESKKCSFLSLSRLLSVLAASPMGPASHLDASNDLEHMLRQGRNIKTKDQSQALSLLRTQQFQNWIASKHSTVLLVDGNMDSAVARASPMSLLCASLVLNVLDKQPAIALHYFCGLHTASNSPLCGPTGLIRSLLMQLLLVSKTIDVEGNTFTIDHRIFSSDFIDTRLYREDLESHNVAALCHAFKMLVEQLPLDVFVFCIIDAINLYERSEWLDDLLMIVTSLNQIAQNARLQPIFKLLMTSARTSRYVQQHIEPQQRVRIRQGRGNGKGISQRCVMNAAMRPSLLPEPTLHRPGYRDPSDDDDSGEDEYEY
ncbi:MAG: hypothetical protein Q9196_001801 [Gyalolechia fulgens]